MYQVLYRKWRPKVFSDVVGQQHITGTLLSQIQEDRVPHAYMFTGSRGTGKTTCAKIFAKAINCLNPVNGEPCCECEICRSIDNGSNLDVVEMDAASNRNLDDIKELLDEVNYPPTRSKFRVYIIDEVHMLTSFAFNALLKTLEEPPEYVRFILATTDIQKVPTTIVSRCQRFDFRRIEPDVIAERLSYIAKAEGGSIDRDAGEYIAKIADGGMRDSLSLLDRCLSITNNVTSDTVADSAGLIGREYLYDILRAIGNKETAKVIGILDNLHKNSCDTERLCIDIIECFRNFLVLKTVEHPEKLIVCTASELDTIRSVAGMFSDEFVVYALGVLAEVSDNMRNSQNRRIEAEMAFIRLCRPEAENNTAALLARINQLEKEVEELKKNGVKVSQASAAVASQSEKPVVKAFDIPQTPVAKPETAPAKKPEPTISETPFAAAPKTSAPAFSGFASAVSAGSFADAFSSLPADDEPADDAPFDFDKFMADAANGDDDGPAVVPSQGDFDEDEFVDVDDLIPPEDDGYIPDVPFEDEEPSSAPFSQPASQPRENPVSAPSSADSSDNSGPIDRKTWASIVKEIESRSKPLIGQLTGSTAIIQGNTIKVKPANLIFLPERLLVDNIRPVVKEILGRQYNIIIQ